MSRQKPEWIGNHDHFWSIPNTESFVFYPYNDYEANEEYLNTKYGKYGYKVIVKPKVESEYNSAQHQSYKVLILEPNHDERKIDEGCELIAQFFRDYWSKGGYDLFEK